MIRSRRTLFIVIASVVIGGLAVFWVTRSVASPRIIGSLTPGDVRELRLGARLAHQETIAETRAAPGMDSLLSSVRMAFAEVESIAGQAEVGTASVAYRNGFNGHQYFIYWFTKSGTNGWECSSQTRN